LLERVAQRFGDEPGLDGISGRTVALDGRSSASWRRDAAFLTDDNLWNAVNSASIFLRREVVTRVGEFDTRLGLGAGTAWSSGEEIDYVIRAVREGARIAYDPGLIVIHDVATLDENELRQLGYRDGASVGYLLGKHRYPNRVVARMAIRPIGGAIVSLARLDRAQAGVHLATLRGRLAGYRATRSSKIAA
jgi:GT2 family glycosyltransferase